MCVCVCVCQADRTFHHCTHACTWLKVTPSWCWGHRLVLGKMRVFGNAGSRNSWGPGGFCFYTQLTWHDGWRWNSRSPDCSAVGHAACVNRITGWKIAAYDFAVCVSLGTSFPGSSDGKESACQCRRPSFNPWVRKDPWGREWQPTPVFLPGESHGQRSLAGYSPWGCTELDTTEQLNRHHQRCHTLIFFCLAYLT